MSKQTDETAGNYRGVDARRRGGQSRCDVETLVTDTAPGPGLLETALAAAHMGVVPVPCHPRSKVPCVKWKEWQTRMPPDELIAEWFADSCRNIGVLTTGRLVFDCDDPAKAEVVIQECGDTPQQLRTPRGGIHLAYRRRRGLQVGNRVKIRGMPIDIRTDGGLEMIPPSRTEDGAYEWIGEGLLPVGELPFGNIAWTRERRRSRVRAVLTHPEFPPADRGKIRNPEAYCRSITSVMVQNGSKGLVRVVCILRDAGRSAADAFAYLLAWNQTNALPPWSDGELRHALERHFGMK